MASPSSRQPEAITKRLVVVVSHGNGSNTVDAFMKSTEKFISKSEAETFCYGRDFARRLRAGSFVGLYGDLGAGKTQFVKGVCDAFHVSEVVNSPTFTIVNEYHGTLPVFHIDLYRMKNVEEILGIGVDEYIEAGGVCLVEWAEKLDGIIPEKRYEVRIAVVDDSTREIAITSVEGKD